MNESSIIIKSGGSLILKNVTIIMDSNWTSGQIKIIVETGGALIINGSKIFGVRPYYYGYSFLVESGAILQIKNSELKGGGHSTGEGLDKINGWTGLTILTSNAFIENNIIHDGIIAIFIVGPKAAGTKIINNTIYNVNEGIRIRDQDGTVITNNTINAYLRGIDIRDSDNNQILGNTIAVRDYYGIKLVNSNNNYVNETIVTKSPKASILIEDSNNNQITNFTLAGSINLTGASKNNTLVNASFDSVKIEVSGNAEAPFLKKNESDPGTQWQDPNKPQNQFSLESAKRFLSNIWTNYWPLVLIVIIVSIILIEWRILGKYYGPRKVKTIIYRRLPPQSPKRTKNKPPNSIKEKELI